MTDEPLDNLLPRIKDLKERNEVLKEALRTIQKVLEPSTTPNKKKEKGKKKKEKKKKDNEKFDGFVWCGKEGNFDAYRCETCIAIVRGDKIDKHRCMEHNKKRKRENEKVIEKKKLKKTTQEPILIDGFTLQNTSRKRATYYQCNRCKAIINTRNVPSHECSEPVVAQIPTLIVVHDEEDIDNPRYKGPIDNWTWAEYRKNFSCYRCNHCHVVMRHEYIDRHQCPLEQHVTIKAELNEHGISIL